MQLLQITSHFSFNRLTTTVHIMEPVTKQLKLTVANMDLPKLEEDQLWEDKLEDLVKAKEEEIASKQAKLTKISKKLAEIERRLAEKEKNQTEIEKDFESANRTPSSTLRQRQVAEGQVSVYERLRATCESEVQRDEERDSRFMEEKKNTQRLLEIEKKLKELELALSNKIRVITRQNFENVHQESPRKLSFSESLKSTNTLVMSSCHARLLRRLHALLSSSSSSYSVSLPR